jgi:hypothetical protein
MPCHVHAIALFVGITIAKACRHQKFRYPELRCSSWFAFPVCFISFQEVFFGVPRMSWISGAGAQME